jgi:mono/diheme cytochrome c family protein
MKNILVTLFFLASIFMMVNAEEITGESVYKAKCASCHNLDVKKDMTPKERLELMKERKAPPMVKVSAKVRDAFKEDSNKSIAFIADYLVSPDANKSVCMAMAVKKFGVMPAIGKSMTPKEIEMVSKWLVTNFDTKWSDVMKGKCQDKRKGSACCAGKKSMKCATGKCGSDKNSSKKCGGDK